MFNPTQVVIEAFVQELQAMYLRNYGVLEPITRASSRSSVAELCPQFGIRPTVRRNCSIYGGRRDQFELRFCH